MKRPWQALAWFTCGAVLAALGSACGSSDSDAGGSGPNPQVGGAGGAGGAGGSGTGGAGDTVFPIAPVQSLESFAALGAVGVGGAECPGYDPAQAVADFGVSAADPGNTASATRAREALSASQKPVPAAVRTEDFMNYYVGPAPATAPDNKLAPKLELRKRSIEGVDIPTQFDLFVGVTAGKVVPRPKTVLTVLVDASLAPEGLSRAQAVVAALGGGLQAGDHITLMSTDEAVLITELELANPAAELALLAAGVDVGTGTVAARLPAAYAKAHEHDQPGSWNRIVVIGDGEGDPDAVDYAKIEAEALSKIFLTTIGVSPESTYGDFLLYRLSHAGRGRYLYIDDSSEPAALFSSRFEELFGVARDSVRVQVKLPWFLRSLESDPQAQGNDPGTKQYLAPGESLRFLFRVGACSAAVMASPEQALPISVSIDSVLPNAQQDYVGPYEKPVQDLLSAASAAQPGTLKVDQMLATQAFVDALRYPVPTRFDEATARLGSLKAAPFPAMLQQLAQHPNYPKPK